MNLTKIVRVVLISTLIGLTGCASTGHLEKNLVPFTSTNYILIDKEITYEEGRGLGSAMLWKEGLKPGKYTAEFANELGIFYRGPENCVIQYMGTGLMGPYSGGIWIPKDRVANQPRLYYYFSPNRGQAFVAGGLILMAILEAGKGELTFMPPIKHQHFLDSIQIRSE